MATGAETVELGIKAEVTSGSVTSGPVVTKVNISADAPEAVSTLVCLIEGLEHIKDPECKKCSKRHPHHYLISKRLREIRHPFITLIRNMGFARILVYVILLGYDPDIQWVLVQLLILNLLNLGLKVH